MRITDNAPVIDNIRQHGTNGGSAAKSLERSGSGNSVTNTGYDGVTLEISGKIRTSHRGLDETSIRAQESISIAQTAEDVLEKAQNILQKMHDLATRSADFTNQENRLDLDFEYTQYKFELSELNTIRFNDIEFIRTDASVTLEFSLDVGSGNTTEVAINALDIDNLGNVGTPATAENALANISSTINETSVAQEKLAGVREGLQNDMRNRSISTDSQQGAYLQDAGSRVSDADIAKRMIESVRSSLLSGSKTADFAQGNTLPQGVMRLLGVS